MFRYLFAALMLAAAPARFEVASIKPNPVGMQGGERAPKESIRTGPATLTVVNARLSSIIMAAYGVREDQFSAPAWMNSETFDIQAKSSGPVSQDQMYLMLRALLEERFHLALHHLQKEMSIYALTAPQGGFKLHESKESGAPTLDIANGAFNFHNFSMADFAGKVSGPPFHLDRPVKDMTGLPGSYDFSVKIAAGNGEMKHTMEALQNDSAEDAPSIPAMIRDQLGLRLEARKAATDVIVIDKADKVPADN